MPTREEANAGRSYTIGDLSKLYRVSLRTLRFYEERNLLRPGRDGHRRLYSDQDRVRLETILKAKRLGFSLTEIWNLLEERAKAEAEDVASPTSTFLSLSRDEIDARIAYLQQESVRVGTVIDELREAIARRDDDRDDAQTCRPHLFASTG